jgi:hypothetical protein
MRTMLLLTSTPGNTERKRTSRTITVYLIPDYRFDILPFSSKKKPPDSSLRR